MHDYRFVVTDRLKLAEVTEADLDDLYALSADPRVWQRTAVRAGLQLVWRGPDVGSPDPSAVRLVYADRPLVREQIEAMSAYP